MSTPTAPPSGLGFSMLFPPGWREFRTDVESERELTELATRGARDAGRADVALAIRQHIHRMFEGLRRRRALGVHLPVVTMDDSVLPASLTVVPVRFAPGGLARAVADRAGDAAVEEVDATGARWYRWYDRADQLEGQDAAASVTLHYMIPRPDDAGALHLLYAYTVLTEDRGEEPDRSLETLGHGIIGTFEWGRPA
ncbi:hypothetical protein [Microbacterium gallinarum]|uniref:PAS domain-containing protein n=1 Tax=Microbacterium gallinarum TaxID=2762209 RepID=A0ABR8X5J6_9MICO|nr:hypothetical protein [Microbacterium gallinarum]MBD8024604.1 hypothetical protein [Microbacterium gallinarum]